MRIPVKPGAVGEAVALARRLLNLSSTPEVPSPPASMLLGDYAWSGGSVRDVTGTLEVSAAPFASASISAGSKSFLSEYFYQTEDPLPGSPAFTSAVYAAGFRVWLHVTQYTGKIKATYAFLAASAEINGFEAQVYIQQFGNIIGGPPLPSINGMNFDVEIYADLKAYIDGMGKFLADNHADQSKVKPLLVAFNLLDSTTTSLVPLEATPEFRYCMWGIRDGSSLKKALQDASLPAYAPLDPLKIRESYATFLQRPAYMNPESGLDDQRPSDGDAEKASRWIHRYMRK